MIPQLLVTQLTQWAVSQTSRPYILDVREIHELKTATLTHSSFDVVHIPLGQLPKRWQELDPNRAIACLCHHGMRSLQAALFLQSQGLNASNIVGGIHAWAQQIDPAVPCYD